VSPSRLIKGFQRRVNVLWRDQPSQYDIEALQANIERVGLVIRIRWALVAALIAYSLLAVVLYAASGQADALRANLVVPGVALVFVLVYNTYYQLTYRRFGNITVFNHLQLLLDIAVVGVLVYYSGGVYSWFWSMFLLFILEAALILPKRRHVWMIAGAAMLIDVGILVLELVGWLPHVHVPFSENTLQAQWSYVGVRGLWAVTMMAGAAVVGMTIAEQQRKVERELAATSVVDRLTGRYNRPHFLRTLRGEIRRAERLGGSVSLVLLDVDRFDDFNRLFGFSEGDAALAELGERLADVLADGVDQGWDLGTVFRFGGEEFAVVLPQGDVTLPGGCPRGHSRRLADSLLAASTLVSREELRLSSSVGCATFPADADTAGGLLDAAEAGVIAAYESGGGRVVSAGDLRDAAAAEADAALSG
jgi:diguanylate cyclase (GGDEF)-like protein